MYYSFGIMLLLVFIVVFYFLSKNKGGRNNSETDAKRFARLLVSEIKLFNESKVQRGLENKNLSDALRDEIGEARTKYKYRVLNADDERHFDDALIKILADGDKSKFDSGINLSLR